MSVDLISSTRSLSLVGLSNTSFARNYENTVEIWNNGILSKTIAACSANPMYLIPKSNNIACSSNIAEDGFRYIAIIDTSIGSLVKKIHSSPDRYRPFYLNLKGVFNNSTLIASDRICGDYSLCFNKLYDCYTPTAFDSESGAELLSCETRFGSMGAEAAYARHWLPNGLWYFYVQYNGGTFISVNLPIWKSVTPFYVKFRIENNPLGMTYLSNGNLISFHENNVTNIWNTQSDNGGEFKIGKWKSGEDAWVDASLFEKIDWNKLPVPTWALFSFPYKSLFTLSNGYLVLVSITNDLDIYLMSSFSGDLIRKIKVSKSSFILIEPSDVRIAILPNDHIVLDNRDGQLFVIDPLLNINQLDVQ
jgi:hypothetical protein